MKVQIVTAMQGRRDVFAVFFAGIERLKKSFDVDLYVVASEKSDCELLTALGIDHSLCDNQPLGNKWNHAINSVIGRKWDKLLIMGSDDLITDEGFKAGAESYHGHVGFPSCLFYELSSGQSKLFDYRDMRVSRLSGAGRFLSREVVENMWDTVNVYCTIDYGVYIKKNIYTVSKRSADYLVGTKRFKIVGEPKKGLWTPNIAQGLDLDLETTMVSIGYAPFPIDMVAICDLKNGDNMWRYDERDGKYYEASDYFAKISEEERNLISDMKK